MNQRPYKGKAHQTPHKYQKIAVGSKGYEVYKCVLPDCRHFLPTLSLALNRETLCFSCDVVTTITKEQLTPGREVTKPLCPDCRKERQRTREVLGALSQGPEDTAAETISAQILRRIMESRSKEENYEID